ncbi:hypothetical protein Lal_00026894 [Lupinus albus]|nr:hypothetical protein Lal_00026894 [Lupinus albus]
MMTTQRNESMNNVIKKYVSYKHDMLRFFHHFDRLVDDRQYQQLKTYFKATQRNVSLSFDVEIVRHAATIYTHAVFKMFQSEISLSYDCSVITSFDIDNVSEYIKLCFIRNIFNILSNMTQLKVLLLVVVRSLSLQECCALMLSKGTCLSPTHDDEKARLRNCYKDLCGRYTELTTKGATNEETYKIAVNAWNKAMEAIDACIGGGEMNLLYKT